VGHYLGVDRTKAGRDLDDALQDDANTLEEMKADLVSLFVAEALQKQGYYSKEQLRSVYASGILRVLQNNKPRRDQPYNTMQLMQWNFFLENGLLSVADGKLQIHYDKYHQVAGRMLARTFAVQYSGDKATAAAFIDQYAKWDDQLHGAIAKQFATSNGIASGCSSTQRWVSRVSSGDVTVFGSCVSGVDTLLVILRLDRALVPRPVRRTSPLSKRGWECC